VRGLRFQGARPSRWRAGWNGISTGNLSGVLRKWDEDLAVLEESKRRRVGVALEEIGLLRVILDSRRVVRKYERSRRGG